MKRYDSYKDSGVEWIGVIPSHWEVPRFKHSFKFINEKSELDLPKVGLEHIESWTGKRIEKNTEFEGDGTRFQRDDILFGKLRPYLAKVYLSDIIGKAIGDFFVFRPETNIHPKFGHKLLLSRNFIDITNSSTFGSKMPRVSPDFINELKIIAPPTDEQTVIANYLDLKTAEIDGLIADKKRLLELYEEEKSAIINEAVTKGINPDVPMKDSGNVWLWEIPEHWEMKMMKMIVSKIGSGVTPSGGSSVYLTSGVPLLRSQNIHFDGLRLDDVAFISEEIDERMSNSRIQEGDVLLNITGASIGRCFYVPINFGRGNVNQHVCIVRPISEKVDTIYLYFLMRSEIGQVQIKLQQTGANREGLNFEQLRNFILPIPLSIKEQQSIVLHIETECAGIDSKKSKTQKLINLLTEYRTALISEVVTGKIKVV